MSIVVKQRNLVPMKLNDFTVPLQTTVDRGGIEVTSSVVGWFVIPLVCLHITLPACGVNFSYIFFIQLA